MQSGRQGDAEADREMQSGRQGDAQADRGMHRQTGGCSQASGSSAGIVAAASQSDRWWSFGEPAEEPIHSGPDPHPHNGRRTQPTREGTAKARLTPSLPHVRHLPVTGTACSSQRGWTLSSSTPGLNRPLQLDLLPATAPGPPPLAPPHSNPATSPGPPPSPPALKSCNLSSAPASPPSLKPMSPQPTAPP